MTQPFHAEVLGPAGADRRAFEAELLERGLSVPVRTRLAWTEGPKEVGFVAVRDALGDAACGFSLRSSPARVLPGHVILRAKRVGAGAAPGAIVKGVEAATRFASERARVLRLHLEFFIADPEARAAAEAACEVEGYQRVATPWSYSETILIDLAPSETDLFAGFHRTGRRHVRAVDKNPVAVRPITDPALAGRMDELLQETMSRTGGDDYEEPWSEVLRFCADHPSTVRLVGLFDERPQAEEPLLAFALGFNHGQHIEYATAASTRDTDLNVPLAYGPAWDLMRWGKASGARWFDFGGVTWGTADSSDPLGGVSDFKRYFSTNALRVGTEWAIEPRLVTAAAARASRRIFGLLRSS